MQYILEKIDSLNNKYKNLLDKKQKLSRKVAFECLDYLNEIDKIRDEIHKFINEPIKDCEPSITKLIINQNEEFKSTIIIISNLLASCIVDVNIYNGITYLNDFEIEKTLQKDLLVIKNPIIGKEMTIKMHLYLFCLIKIPVELIKKKILTFRENCLYKIIFKEEIETVEQDSLIYLEMIKIMLDRGIYIGTKLKFPVEDFLVAQNFLEILNGDEELFNLYRLISHEITSKTFISIYEYTPKKILFMVQKIIDQIILLDSFGFNINISILSFNYELAHDFERKTELEMILNDIDDDVIINFKVDDLYDFEPRAVRVIIENENSIVS